MDLRNWPSEPRPRYDVCFARSLTFRSKPTSFLKAWRSLSNTSVLPGAASKHRSITALASIFSTLGGLGARTAVAARSARGGSGSLRVASYLSNRGCNAFISTKSSGSHFAKTAPSAPTKSMSWPNAPRIGLRLPCKASSAPMRKASAFLCRSGDNPCWSCTSYEDEGKVAGSVAHLRHRASHSSPGGNNVNCSARAPPPAVSSIVPATAYTTWSFVVE